VISLLAFPSILLLSFLMHIHSMEDFFIFKLKKSAYDSSKLFDSLIKDGGANFVHSHAIAYLSVPFMMLTILYLGNLLFPKKPILAFFGVLIGIFGAIFMAGFFGAWLSFSAISRVEPQNYIGAKASLAELTRMSGVLKVITQLSLFSLIGIMVLCVGLIQAKLLPKWSTISILLGCIIILVFMGLPNWMFLGSIFIFIGLVPVSQLFKTKSF
jgi:hypothetical protein